MGTRVPQKTGVPPRISGFLIITPMSGLYPEGLSRVREEGKIRGEISRGARNDSSGTKYVRYLEAWGVAGGEVKIRARGGGGTRIGLGDHPLADSGICPMRDACAADPFDERGRFGRDDDN